MRARFTGPLVRAAAVKLFVDGVIETHTAYLAEPYADRPGFRGAPVWAPERLIEASRGRRARPASSSTTTPSATPPSRWRSTRSPPPGGAGAARRAPARDIITHLQLVDPRDYARMAAFGVVAAVQPYWFAREAGLLPRVYRPLLGRARRPPVPDEEPAATPASRRGGQRLPGVAAAGPAARPSSAAYCAATRGIRRQRRAVAGGGGRASRRSIEASRSPAPGRTSSSTRPGRWRSGKSADLVVLRENLLELPAERIHEAAVELTALPRPAGVRRWPVRRLARTDSATRARADLSSAGASTRARRARPAPACAARRRARRARAGRASRPPHGRGARRRTRASSSAACSSRARPKSLGAGDHELAGHARCRAAAARRSTAIAGSSYTPKTASGRARPRAAGLRRPRAPASLSSGTSSSRGSSPCSSHQARVGAQPSASSSRRSST